MFYQKTFKTKFIYCLIFIVLFFKLDQYCNAARPFATDDAYTVKSGEYELEIGCDFSKEITELGLGFKHGITDKMDIGIGMGYITNFNPGYSPAELILKVALIKDLLSFSFTTELGTTNYKINAILTKKFFDFIEFDLNLGYYIISAGEINEEKTVTFAFAIIWEFSNFDTGFETLGDKEGLENWLLGVRYSLLEGLNIDAGVSGDYENFNTENMVVTTGIHYEF